MPSNLADLLRLVLVTDDALVEARDLPDRCAAAVRGGVTAVQVRLKRVEPQRLAGVVRAVLSAVQVPVFVNDRLDVALACGAAGVHLGSDDLPLGRARRLVPPGFLLGASVGGAEEAAGGVGADYWGVGPFRTTTTKADAGAALGARGLAGVVRLAAGRPCVAIGGVLPEDVPVALGAGAVGVAVVSGILAAGDAEAAARAYAIPR